MLSLSLLPTTLLVFLSTAVSAEELSHGVEIEETTPATCSRPTQNGDTIKVNYRGTLASNGEEFDSSYGRGQPIEFILGVHQVIEGWDIALLGMCPGEGRKLTIPPELAYGSRPMGSIPAHSTLVFETVLEEIVGVEQPTEASLASALSSAMGEIVTSATPSPTVTDEDKVEDELFSIATAPATPEPEEVHDADKSTQQPNKPEDGPIENGEKEKQRCNFLGPFALLVQGALGAFALLTLVWKRYREKPQRPWKIWFFDVSKQVFGSMLTHVLNVGMSMISSVNLQGHAEKFGSQAAADAVGRKPNPCSFYLLNLAIDTTLGIPVLYILLIIVHALCLRTPLARPPASLKSGNYDEPPRWSWYFKQLMIYFIGLTGMKFCVFLLFSALPWLPWVGDWALRWTQFDERVELAFALFIFPLFMNAVQYYVIDNLIMDKKRDKVGYQAVNEDEDEEARLVEESTLHDEEDERFKIDDEEEPLTAEEERRTRRNDGSSSGTSTLKGSDIDQGKKSD